MPFQSVAPAVVIIVACLWLLVWIVCLALTLRFVVILVAAGVLQGWESWKKDTGQPPPAQGGGPAAPDGGI